MLNIKKLHNVKKSVNVLFHAIVIYFLTDLPFSFDPIFQNQDKKHISNSSSYNFDMKCKKLGIQKVLVLNLNAVIHFFDYFNRKKNLL